MVVTYRKGRVEIPTFHWSIDIVVTREVVEYAKHRGWRSNGKESTTSGMNLFFDEDLLSVIIIQPDANAGTVAHEAWHCVRRMLLHMGADLDNEVVAYHLGYLVNKITDFKKKVTYQRRKNGTAKKS